MLARPAIPRLVRRRAPAERFRTRPSRRDLVGLEGPMRDLETDDGMTETSRQDMRWAHRQRHEPGGTNVSYCTNVYGQDGTEVVRAKLIELVGHHSGSEFAAEF